MNVKSSPQGVFLLFLFISWQVGLTDSATYVHEILTSPNQIYPTHSVTIVSNLYTKSKYNPLDLSVCKISFVQKDGVPKQSILYEIKVGAFVSNPVVPEENGYNPPCSYRLSFWNLLGERMENKLYCPFEPPKVFYIGDLGKPRIDPFIQVSFDRQAFHQETISLLEVHIRALVFDKNNHYFQNADGGLNVVCVPNEGQSHVSTNEGYPVHEIQTSMSDYYPSTGVLIQTRGYPMMVSQPTNMCILTFKPLGFTTNQEKYFFFIEILEFTADPYHIDHPNSGCSHVLIIRNNLDLRHNVTYHCPHDNLKYRVLHHNGRPRPIPSVEIDMFQQKIGTFGRFQYKVEVKEMYDSGEFAHADGYVYISCDPKSQEELPLVKMDIAVGWKVFSLPGFYVESSNFPSRTTVPTSACQINFQPNPGTDLNDLFHLSFVLTLLNVTTPKDSAVRCEYKLSIENKMDEVPMQNILCPNGTMREFILRHRGKPSKDPSIAFEFKRQIWGAVGNFRLKVEVQRNQPPVPADGTLRVMCKQQEETPWPPPSTPPIFEFTTPNTTMRPVIQSPPVIPSLPFIDEEDLRYPIHELFNTPSQIYESNIVTILSKGFPSFATDTEPYLCYFQFLPMDAAIDQNLFYLIEVKHFTVDNSSGSCPYVLSTMNLLGRKRTSRDICPYVDVPTPILYELGGPSSNPMVGLQWIRIDIEAKARFKVKIEVTERHKVEGVHYRPNGKLRVTCTPEANGSSPYQQGRFSSSNIRSLPQNNHPRARSRDPFATIRDAIARTRDALAKTRDSIANIMDIVARSRDPVAQSKDPVARSRDPVARSRDPVARSRDSVVQSRDPVAKDSGTVAQSRDPVPKDSGTVAKNSSKGYVIKGASTRKTYPAVQQTKQVPRDAGVVSHDTAVFQSKAPVALDASSGGTSVTSASVKPNQTDPPDIDGVGGSSTPPSDHDKHTTGIAAGSTVGVICVIVIVVVGVVKQRQRLKKRQDVNDTTPTPTPIQPSKSQGLGPITAVSAE